MRNADIPAQVDGDLIVDEHGVSFEAWGLSIPKDALTPTEIEGVTQRLTAGAQPRHPFQSKIRIDFHKHPKVNRRDFVRWEILGPHLS